MSSEILSFFFLFFFVELYEPHHVAIGKFFLEDCGVMPMMMFSKGKLNKDVIIIVIYYCRCFPTWPEYLWCLKMPEMLDSIWHSTHNQRACWGLLSLVNDLPRGFILSKFTSNICSISIITLNYTLFK